MLMKKFLVGLLLFSFTMHHTSVVCTSTTTEKIVEEKPQVIIVVQPIIEKEPVEYKDYSYIPDLTQKELFDIIIELTKYKMYLEELYDDSFEVLNEINKTHGLIVFYQSDLELALEKQMHFSNCAKEYPEATKVWLYMKENFGWSDTVCAGILGNIMAEIGGGSPEGAMNFGEKWKVDKSSGLGMFQWTGGRRKGIKAVYGQNPTMEQQLEYMFDELFGTDGVGQQVKPNELEAILEAETPEMVAYNFACYFERCGSAYRNPRKGYARFAYDYFTY